MLEGIKVIEMATYIAAPGLLAAIVEIEDGGALEVVGADILHGVAHGAAGQRFDLQDFRAPVRKDAARAGRGDIGGHFNDLDALEHGFRSPLAKFLIGADHP